MLSATNTPAQSTRFLASRFTVRPSCGSRRAAFKSNDCENGRFDARLALSTAAPRSSAIPFDTYPHLPHNTALGAKEIETKGLLFAPSGPQAPPGGNDVPARRLEQVIRAITELQAPRH
jgi:hypothetical protein